MLNECSYPCCGVGIVVADNDGGGCMSKIDC